MGVPPLPASLAGDLAGGGSICAAALAKSSASLIEPRVDEEALFEPRIKQKFMKWELEEK